jgi:predicted permease
MTLRPAVLRVLALLRRSRLDRDLEGEIAAHLELAERDGRRAGLSPEEARRTARREFGHVESMREAHRDQRSARWIEHLAKDVRFGFASLLRRPGFTAAATAVLALGIGANAAMFSVVDAVLLRPLPFPQPDRLVRVAEISGTGGTNNTSTPDFLDWRRLATSFDALGAELSLTAALVTGASDPLRLAGKAVSSDYFDVFGLEALVGRTLVPADDRPGTRVVVLSHAAWQTYLGGTPDVLDRRLLLDGEPHQIVGVLAPGAFDRDDVRFWKPLALDPDEQPRSWHWLTVHGRLRRNVTLEQARDDMRGIDAALADVTPAYKREWTIQVRPLEAMLVGDSLRHSVVVAFGAVLVVLLIACANVANLLLARGIARRREMAVRSALGASRGRLVAQLLTETVLLCLAGGAAGVALAYGLIEVARPALGAALPYTAHVTLDVRVLVFAAAVAVGMAFLAGTVPAWQASSAGPSSVLNGSGRGASAATGRLRQAIVVGEVALTLVLVCAAALLFRSLWNLQRLDTGVRVDHVIATSLDLPLHAYPTVERAAAFYPALVEQLESVPGVERVALASHLPLRWIGNGEGLRAPGREGMINVRFKRVDAAYFDVLAIRLKAGRGITAADRAGARPVAVINEALAARLAEHAGIQDPIGRLVTLGCPRYAEQGAEMTDVEIVGVIRSERVADPWRPDPPVAYVPLAQVPIAELRILATSPLDAGALVPAMREALKRVDPYLALGEVATMRQVHAGTLSAATRPAWVIGVFALLAGVLAAIGLYGVVTHTVAQERREIGIRMALGARPRDVLARVLRSALATVAIGLGLGLAATLATTRLLASLLFDVRPHDPAALVFACAALLLLGLAAGVLPARRAAAVHPVEVLREE